MLAVGFAWIFFRSPSLGMALRYIELILTIGPRLNTFTIELSALSLDTPEWQVLVSLIVLLTLAELLAKKKRKSLPVLLADAPYQLRYVAFFVFLSVTVVLGVYGPSHETARPIYMQF